MNADAIRSDRSVTIRQTGQSQVLVLHACPMPGPLADVSAWTMTRAFTGQGRTYNQLLIGLVVLGLTVLGSAMWLGRILYTWSRKITILETALAAHQAAQTDFPALPLTGERELDRLVEALNATGILLAEVHRRATSAERLAAVGRLAAGLAHEIRNPIAAMRLKAENALAGDDNRRISALKTILEQIARLDVLLRDLLTMTQQRTLQLVPNDLMTFLDQTIVPHHDLAIEKGVMLQASTCEANATRPRIRRREDASRAGQSDPQRHRKHASGRNRKRGSRQSRWPKSSSVCATPARVFRRISENVYLNRSSPAGPKEPVWASRSYAKSRAPMEVTSGLRQITAGLPSRSRCHADHPDRQR